MTKTKSTSFTLATFCFIIALAAFCVLLFLKSSGDDTLMLLCYVSAGAALISLVMCIATLRGKSRKGISVVLLLLNLGILAVYGWMYAANWVLRQSVNEMMNAQ